MQGSETDDAFAAYFAAGEFAPVIPVATESGPGERVSIAVGPNPSRGAAAITVRLDAPSAVTVDIVDTVGRTVAELWTGALVAGDTQLAVPSLAPGVYIVRVRGDASAFTSLTVLR